MRLTTDDPVWDVKEPFTTCVVVTPEHIDEFGHTNNVNYLRWLEKTAWAHSEFLGLDMQRYRDLGAGCVARRHELDYLAATYAGDELTVATWVDENDFRLSMWRGYQIVRDSDHKVVMRGRTQFVCVNVVTGKPTRMPPEFVDAYEVALKRPKQS